MGNNASSTDSNIVPVSSSSAGPARNYLTHTHWTHSLPSTHQHQLRNHCHYRQESGHLNQHGPSNRRHTTTTFATSVSPVVVRPSSRFRQVLPNFVNNVSMVFGQKFPWPNNKRLQKFRRNYHAVNSRFGIGKKGEKRSRSKTREHCRLFRELIANWKLSDLHCLVVEFEAALVLRELQRRADCARPRALSLKDDFVRLYRDLSCDRQTSSFDDSSADAFLLLDGHTFAVHRAFLSRRCPFFRRLFLTSVNSSASVRCSSSVSYNGKWRPTVPVTFPPSMTPLTPYTFKLLLEYLYTGELSATSSNDDAVETLVRFHDELKRTTRDATRRCADNDRNWTSLEDDVAALMKDINESNFGADALLIFTNGKSGSILTPQTFDNDCELDYVGESTMMTDDRGSNALSVVAISEQYKAKSCQFKCHSVVLAARSPFFRSIIRKRRLQDEQRQQDDNQSQGGSVWRKASAMSASGLLEIVLDESVIPRQYAPVLLHAMYTDEVDLSLVMRDCVSSAASCLTEVQAIAAGKCQSSPIDEATEIYQIARFLEFDKLAQGCEDAIISYLTLDTLTTMYNWSKESYGSPYVRRHCVDYLCQEFSRFCTSVSFLDVDESLLVSALKSDYVQASELDILNSVIKWGEHQLVRRLEEREPNILVGTTHSISRKGVKRTDLSDEELKEILAAVLPLIRVDYILPQSHTVLQNAVSRGLINAPPCDLLSVSSLSPNVLLPPAVAARRSNVKRSTAGHTRHSPAALVRSCSSSASPMDEADTFPPMEQSSQDHWSQPHRHSAGPRLFVPYLDEARALLEKRVAESPDQLSSLINHHPPVETVSSHFLTRRSNGSGRFPDALYMVGDMTDGELCSQDDFDATELTVPPPATLLILKDRIDQILRNSSTVKRALACGCMYHRNGVLKQIRLRAVRELGLLDSTIRVLDNYNQLVVEASTDERSFCTSPTYDQGYQVRFDSELSGLDDSLEYMDHSMAARRRFRSQPELSQCDLVGSAPATMDWPDLMAMTTNGVDGECSGLNYARRAASSSFAISDWSPVSLDWTSSTVASPSSELCSKEQRLSKMESKENLRQQFVDLTQQICDLVVAGEDVHKEWSQENGDSKDMDKSSPPVELTPDAHRRQDTAV